jgi:hypothetical protein
MNISKEDIEKRLAQLKQEVPTRGWERHPTILKSLSDLPAELRAASVIESAKGKPYDTIISFPPQIQRGRHYIPRQALLFTTRTVTHVLASIWPGEAPEVTLLQGRDLLYIKVTLLLLYGRLEIVAKGLAAPVQFAMEFNTVAWDQFATPLRQLLQATKPSPNLPSDPTTISASAAAAAENLPLKFSNGLRIHGLLPGEELEEMLFQAGIKERLLLLFNRSIVANTLVLLTSHFVTVVQEELKVAQGWIVSYIPRPNIVRVEHHPCEKWDELTFRLEREGQEAAYSLRLKYEAALAWKAILAAHGGGWLEVSATAASRVE